MSPLLLLITPTIEACCKALLTGESQVITREERALLNELGGLLRDERGPITRRPGRPC